MTGGQFRKCVEILRWPQVRIAEDLGVQHIKVRRWSAGIDPVPEVVAVWIRAMASEAEDMRQRNPPPVVPRMPARRRSAKRTTVPQADHVGRRCPDQPPNGPT
jgi:hypothetical protein